MKRQFISSVILMILMCLYVIEVESWDDKVLLENVRALTLYRGKYTTGRRKEPIKQIKCVGGDAGCRYEPDVIQCRNIGSDGTNPNWKCEATLPNSLKFGRLKVECEGYNYRDDPYILKGSCGLKYTLYYTNDEKKKKQWYNNWFDDEIKVDGYQNKSSLFSTLFGIVWLCMLGYMFYSAYLAYMRTRRANNRPINFQNPGFRPPDDGGGDEPYHNHPNYDSSSSTRRAYRGENIPYPGFWTGLLGGGLLGYLFGGRNNNDNNNNNNYSRTRRREEERKRSPPPKYSTSSSYFTRNNDDYDWLHNSDYSYTTHTTSYNSYNDDDNSYTAYGFADTDRR